VYDEPSESEIDRVYFEDSPVESSKAPVIDPKIDTPIERVRIQPVQIATNLIFIVL
tara:strand:+ start:3703 stop:3870 length:168 start_codon:yes stop_codon:yes gene_type:complete